MTREELIQLVEDVMTCSGTEVEQDELVEMLRENVAHPRVLDLINADPQLSAEQIVDQALAYRPIAL
ncbi:bacteriocin immunity protein [Streptomyces sp. URMC 126]|uniref:bacteriocin immunity protein n=1 Tax=Streptomyces sp. URMC 126 TaxID=3423401 RepID=UPI003F1CE2D0